MTSKQTAIKQIPFQNLKVWEGNMRKAAAPKQSDNELYASIKSQNLLKNLIVFLDDDGSYAVAGGGRRLKALDRLVKEGHFDANHPVSCRVIEKENAMLATIHENIYETPHSADLYTAYKNLADQNHSVKEIALMFGKPAKEVEKILTLARVHEDLMTLFRQNKIDLASMVAFAVTADREKQIACWNALKQSKPSANQIKQFLTKSYYDQNDAIAKIVGIDRYKAAGGEISKDIFDNTVYFHDMELVETLAEDIKKEKLDAVIGEGWKWVEYSDSFQGYRRDLTKLNADFVGVPKSLLNSIAKVEKKIDEWEEKDDYSSASLKEYELLENERDELLQQKEEYRNYTQDVISKTGAIVTLDDHGFSVYRGLLKHEDARTVQNSSNKIDTQPEQASMESQALLTDLGVYHSVSFQAAMLRHPMLCLDIFIYEIAKKELAGYCDALVQFSMRGAPKEAVELEQSKAYEVINEFKSSLDLTWLELEGEAAVNAFCSLSLDTKLQILSYCVATNSHGKIDSASDSQMYIAKATQFNVADFWQPTFGNYFNRINKAALVDIGKTFFAEGWEEDAIKKKKSDVCQEVAANTGKHTWLPRQFKRENLD